VEVLRCDRVEGAGLAGSRPLMDGKNGRRVEFHLSAADEALLPDLPPE